MKTVILWFFSQIALFIETSLSWKIYGDFSLTHFILGGLFLLALFSLFGFATHNFGNGVETIALGYKNAENRKDKLNYYNYTRTIGYKADHKGYSTRSSYSNSYKVNRKTGKEKIVGTVANTTTIYKG